MFQFTAGDPADGELKYALEIYRVYFILCPSVRRIGDSQNPRQGFALIVALESCHAFTV